MRIGLLVYGDLATISGGNIYDRKLVGYLREQGDQVEVLSVPYRSYGRHLTDNFSSALRRKLLGLDVDILIQDELIHPSLAWLNARLKTRLRYPVVSLVHHLRSQEEHPALAKWVYQQVERSYLRAMDGFIFVSQATRRAVQRLVGEQQPAIVANPPSDRFDVMLSPDEIQARLAANAAGPLRIIFLGSLTERKQLHALIEALSRLPSDKYRLTVIGSSQFEPAYAEKMRGLVWQRGLGAQINFLGRVDDAAVVDEMKVHDVLAVPSNYEGFGMVYLEGMGFGLPAIGGTRGGAGEIITSGENGYLVTPGDVDQLAGHFKSLAEDRELLLRLSLAARARFDAHPPWGTTAAAVRAFLAEIAAAHPEGA